jgi:Tetratricopeptide repeat.
VSAAALLLTSGLALGQSTTKDAAEAFNAGVTANEAKNYTEAVIQFNKALDICSQVGAEADEIKLQAEKVIPSVEFNIGLGLYNQKKIEEAISQIDKAKELAIKYGDEKTQKKAERVVPQLYNFLGNGALRDGQYDKAIEFYGKAIALDANYSKCYLGMGLAYSKMNNLDKAIESFDKTIEVGTATNKTEDVKDAKISARDNLLIQAAAEQKKENFADAYKHFSQSLQYDDRSTDAYLGLAAASNKLSKFDDAIENINKALPLLEGSSDSIKAPYYFALGNAFLGKKDNTNACDAYKKASFGTFKEAAEYQIKEVLKCQ